MNCSIKNIRYSTLLVRCFILSIIFFLAVSSYSIAQNTNVVILDTTEIQRLRQLITTKETVRQQYDSVVQLAEQYLADSSRPLKVLYYEGLLETNPDRIDTKKSLQILTK